MDSPEHPIIDCHFHPAVEPGDDTGWFIPSGDIQHQVDVLRLCGITRACGSFIRRFDPRSFGEIRALNDGALALRDRFPEFYEPGVHVLPRFPEESCREIDRCCGVHGVRWIGELVGYMMRGGQDYTTPDALTVMRKAQDIGAVVSFHCGSLDIIDKLCTEVPDLPLVLAHPGNSKDVIMGRLGLVAKHPNLHLDISGTGIDRYGIMRTAVDVAGSDKLLFGSDYPINNPAVYVHGLRLEPLDDDELAAIFHGNFQRLIRPRT